MALVVIERSTVYYKQITVQAGEAKLRWSAKWQKINIPAGGAHQNFQ